MLHKFLFGKTPTFFHVTYVRKSNANKNNAILKVRNKNRVQQDD